MPCRCEPSAIMPAMLILDKEIALAGMIERAERCAVRVPHAFLRSLVLASALGDIRDCDPAPDGAGTPYSSNLSDSARRTSVAASGVISVA
jgi:hypothetical protein